MGSAIRMHKRGTAVLAVGGLALLAAACGSSSSSSSSAKTSGTTATKTGDVTLEIGSPVTSLDPAKGSSFADFTAASALYDPLVSFNQQGKIIPDLATTWTTTPTSATFHLKTGVSCSDGTALTPAVAAASLQRYMDPATAAPLLTEVIGAGNTAKVTSTASTVTVTLSKPFSQLLGGLTSAFTGIVCSAGVKTPATLLTHSDGTGSYVASTEVSGASYTFHSRAGYTWGPKFSDQPAGTVPKTLVLKVVEDDNTAANLMATGALDIAAYSTNDWTRFKGKAGDSYQTQPQTDTMLVFNETPGLVTAKQSVRIAISQAVNRAGLNSVLGNGSGVLETNLGQSTYQCYDPSLGSMIPASNASAATKVLKGLNLRIIGTTQLAAGNGTSYLLAELNQAGAHATLQNSNNEAWVTELFSGKNNWELTILGYGNTENSLLGAAGFFNGMAPPKGENLGDVQNPASDNAYTEAGKVGGPAGCAATSTMQKALLQRNDFVPLTAVPDTVVFTGGTAGSLIKGFVQPSSIRVAG
jgi:peptide/nickel transport system substrate-binding protein